MNGFRRGATGHYSPNTDEWMMTGLDNILDDPDILANIQDSFEANPHIPKRDRDNIKVEVDSGVVYLSGTVSCKESKNWAYLDAFGNPGVVTVINDLKIGSK